MNVSELTLLVLRLGFLLLLWLFIFGIVYALRTDLFGQRVRKFKTDAPNTPAPVDAFAAASVAPAAAARVSSPGPGALDGAAERATARNAGRLVITSGPKAGVEFPLTGESITIGRSNDSSLVIRDDYTSTHHARLMLWNDEWMIQDLDSTNGTFLAGNRVTIPTPVHLDTTVRIGATSFELRR
ncbi:MAG: FHA domain-containing protein [Cryobacterium sp.]